jgi:1-phosphatidylinositol-4-phosphate 5-kinase
MRELAEVTPADYIGQLASDQSLRLLASPGKSGSVFFLSADERFLVKTIRKVRGLRCPPYP